MLVRRIKQILLVGSSPKIKSEDGSLGNQNFESELVHHFDIKYSSVCLIYLILYALVEVSAGVLLIFLNKWINMKDRTVIAIYETFFPYANKLSKRQ